MKKFVFSLFLIIVAFSGLKAQERHPMKSKHSRHNMADKLHFTDNQKVKIKTINEDYHTQMADLKKNDQLTVKEWKEKAHSIRKDEHEKMQALLTPDQKASFEKMKTDRAAMRKIDELAKIDKMKVKLGLTDDQAAKIKNDQITLAERLKALHDNKNMDDATRKDQVKMLRKEQREKMRTILTEDQRKKLQDDHSHKHSWQ